MRIMRLVKIFSILVCVGIYCYSAIDINKGETYNINVDMDRPISIVWPFEVLVVGDGGERGLRIGPKVGRGWLGEAGGEAIYKFYIPEDGKYHIWAYCLWFDECANAVFAQIDDMDKAILGNDPMYGQWHWVRGFDVNLKKGTHTLLLANHSDHIAIQKVLLTNSAATRPGECGVVFSDIFYDGFDGCDKGNFENWEVVSGEWIVENPADQMCFIENALIGKCKDRCLIIYNSDEWSGYSLDVAVKSEAAESSDASIGICFGVENSTRYHQLKWRPIEGGSKVKMEISSKTGEQVEVLSDFKVPWEADKWHQVGIILDGDKITVRVDDAAPIEASIKKPLRGGIGLLLEGKVTAYFDDIHVREIGRGDIKE